MCIRDRSKAVPKAEQMIKELIEGHESVIRTIREMFPTAEQAKDQTTMDAVSYTHLTLPTSDLV